MAMKIYLMIFMLLNGCLFAGDKADSILGKQVQLESHKAFKFIGDEVPSAGIKDGKPFRKRIQLDTVFMTFYPSGMTKSESIAGCGYIYPHKVQILSQSWHPQKSNALLFNIGNQISKKLKIELFDFISSRMNKIGKGMVHQIKGKKATITLILVQTDDENTFYLCGTYSEVK